MQLTERVLDRGPPDDERHGEGGADQPGEEVGEPEAAGAEDDQDPADEVREGVVPLDACGQRHDQQPHRDGLEGLHAREASAPVTNHASPRARRVRTTYLEPMKTTTMASQTGTSPPGPAAASSAAGA